MFSAHMDTATTHLPAGTGSVRAHPASRAAPARHARHVTKARGDDAFARIVTALGEGLSEDLGRLAEDFAKSARAASQKYSEAANTVETEVADKAAAAPEPAKEDSQQNGWERMRQRAREHHAAQLEAVRAFPVDIVEDATRFNLYADVAGLTRQDLKVRMDAKTRRLTISGERRRPAEVEDLDEDGKPRYPEGKRTFERPVGRFERSFMMSKKCDLDAITARVEKGVLHLLVDKKPEEEPNTVEVPIWD